MAIRITSGGQVTIAGDIRQAVRVCTGTALKRGHEPVGQRIIAREATAHVRHREYQHEHGRDHGANLSVPSR